MQQPSGLLLFMLPKVDYVSHSLFFVCIAMHCCTGYVLSGCFERFARDRGCGHVWPAKHDDALYRI